MIFSRNIIFSFFFRSFILLVIFSSCNDTHRPVEEEKEEVNMELLDNILAHLNPADSLAVAAAQFTVENMPYQFSVQGSLIAAYKDSVERYSGDALKMEQSLKRIGGSPPDRFSITFPDDMEYVSPEYLAKNIELALAAYRKAPWKDSISFDLFCKYVLPYKVNREESEDWREAVLSNSEFQKEMAKGNLSMLEAATTLHGSMYQRKKDFKIFDLGLPELPFSCTENLMVGTCHELSLYGVSVMRAYGIPTTIDFTPQFANRSGGHEWCSIVFSEDSCQGFDVTVDSLGYNEFWDPETRFAKVFRRTFHKVEGNHRDKVGFAGYLPNFFNDPRIADATHLYCETTDVRIPTPESTLDSMIYLSVFDNKNWFPIAWGSVTNDAVLFEKLGREAVYLPEVITDSKREPFDYPFVVKKSGEIHFLKSDMNNLDTVRLTRKFPVTARIRLFIGRMVGGNTKKFFFYGLSPTSTRLFSGGAAHEMGHLLDLEHHRGSYSSSERQFLDGKKAYGYIDANDQSHRTIMVQAGVGSTGVITFLRYSDPNINFPDGDPAGDNHAQARNHAAVNRSLATMYVMENKLPETKYVNGVFDNNSFSSFVARDQIIIEPNTSFELGSSFVMEIKNCLE